MEVGKKWSADLLPIIEFDVTTSGQKERSTFAQRSLAAALQSCCRTPNSEGLTNKWIVEPEANMATSDGHWCDQ